MVQRRGRSFRALLRKYVQTRRVELGMKNMKRLGPGSWLVSPWLTGVLFVMLVLVSLSPHPAL
jgi:hypothetical protein